VLEFFGIAPRMRVLDFNAAAGYFTEIVSHIVGPTGAVIAHNHPGALRTLGEDAVMKRYAGGRLPNITTLIARHGELNLSRRNLDVVLLSLVYHDTYWYRAGLDWGPVHRPVLLRAFYSALKPGGIVAVIDHYAEASANPAVSVDALHRIDPAAVIRDFTAAGFVLDAQSNVVRNFEDDHTRSVFDPAIQGRTDRFVMRFRRPE
jgi:predicted methyltransferase